MSFYHFFLGTLFVWRLTHLLNMEDGPGAVVVHLRRLAGAGFVGQVLDCFYCLSVWIAAPLAVCLGKKTSERILLWPALSAGAILLERLTDQHQNHLPASYIEDREDNYAMLWKSESTIQPG